MTRIIELNELVSAYHKVRSLVLPITAIYTTILNILSWNNVPLSAAILVVIIVLLIYPIYLQITLLFLMAVLFGLGYAQSVTNKDSFEQPVIDPVDFINPRYYSLQPKKSLVSKGKTVAEFKEMLSELDTAFTAILTMWDSAVDLVTWHNFLTSRHIVILMSVAVSAPVFLSLNTTLVFLTLYIFCCNGLCHMAVGTWFVGLILPPAVEAQPSVFSDSSDCESEHSIHDIINDKFNESGDSSGIRKTLSRDPNTSVSSQPTSPELRCLTCGVSMTTKPVKCGFCGCLNCGSCCRRTVYKSRLGVTNPATRQHLVLVCNDCYSYLPKT